MSPPPLVSLSGNALDPSCLGNARHGCVILYSFQGGIGVLSFHLAVHSLRHSNYSIVWYSDIPRVPWFRNCRRCSFSLSSLSLYAHAMYRSFTASACSTPVICQKWYQYIFRLHISNAGDIWGNPTESMEVSDFPWLFWVSKPRISCLKRELSGPRLLRGVRFDVSKLAI